jgi:hypothetical protein
MSRREAPLDQRAKRVVVAPMGAFHEGRLTHLNRC